MISSGGDRSLGYGWGDYVEPYCRQQAFCLLNPPHPQRTKGGRTRKCFQRGGGGLITIFFKEGGRGRGGGIFIIMRNLSCTCSRGEGDLHDYLNYYIQLHYD